MNTYEDVLLLLLYVYSLAGPDKEFAPTPQDETTLQVREIQVTVNDITVCDDKFIELNLI